MYEKPILKRFGKLREITKRIVALESIVGDWVVEIPGQDVPSGSAGADGRIS